MNKKSYSSFDSSTWHNRFVKEEEQWKDLERTGKIIVPVIVLFFVIILYLIVYASLSPQKVAIDSPNVFGKIWLLIKLFFSVFAPAVIAGVGIRILSKQSEKIIKDFYQLPDDYNLAPLIKRKLLGVIPLPEPIKKVLNYPFITLEEAGDLEEYHWARWFGGPATLVIYDGVAVYLERGNKFSRVLGPGLPMPVLERYEIIKAIVDLRPQIREATVKTWTKDGIEVEFKVRAEIQIASSDEAKKRSVVLKEEENAMNLVYPFDSDRVKTIVERTAVQYNSETKELSESTWDSAAMGTITGKIKGYISGQAVDELLLEDENSPQFLSFQINDELSNSIKKGLEVAGSQLLDLQIIDLIPVDDEVFTEIINYWNAKKEMIKTIRVGETEAEGIRAKQSAHTKAYQSFLDTLINSLTEINGGEDDMDVDKFTEASVLLLTQVLEQSLSDPILGSLVAREGLRTLTMLKNQLNI